MPVKWLLHWQPNPGTTVSSQIIGEACVCAESLGASRGGRWRSSITFYRPILRGSDGPSGGAGGQMPADVPRDFLGLQLHDQPDRYFFLLREHRILLQADAPMQSLMDKLQSYKARVVLSFEGVQYQLGDFRLRLGKCVTSLADTLRGIMMEVEYLPMSSIEKSRQIMEEFVEIWQENVSKKSLPGHFLHIESNFADYGLQDYYTTQHTAVQYANCMQQLIAAVRS